MTTPISHATLVLELQSICWYDTTSSNVHPQSQLSLDDTTLP